jgi:very-short-patch-repair endonuclease
LHKRTTSKIFYRAKELRRNKTPEEERLWSRLRNHQLDGIGFRQQHAVGDTIVDFCAPRKKLVIELDGSQHLESMESDTKRTAFLESKGYKVIRFFNHEVNENIDDVMQKIRFACDNEIKHESK